MARVLSWDEVAAKYADDPAKLEDARDRYFQQIIAPRYDEPADITAARKAFYESTAPKGVIARTIAKVGTLFEPEKPTVGPNGPIEVKGPITTLGEPTVAQTPVPQQPAYGVLPTVGAISKQLAEGITTHTPAAYAAAIEGAEPDFNNAAIARSRELAKQGVTPYTRPVKTAIPGVSTEDIRQLGPSMGFSLVGQGAGLAGGGAGYLAGSAAGPFAAKAAGYGLGMTASGIAAYRMAENQFVRDLRDANPGMSDAEFEQKRQALMAEIKAYGLYEAIPEAAGNALGWAIIGAPIKGAIGRLFGKNALTRFVTKAATTGAEEIGTETVTQLGQQRQESIAGLTPEKPREFTNPADVWKSFKEVAAVTGLQTAITAGAVAAGRKAAARVARPAPAAPTAPAAPLPEIPTLHGELPAPGQVPIPMGQGGYEPTEVSTAADERAAKLYAARESEAARLAKLGIPPAKKAPAAEPTAQAGEPAGDVGRAKDNAPFKSAHAARFAAEAKDLTETHDVVPVDGGFVLRPKVEQSNQPDLIAGEQEPSAATAESTRTKPQVERRSQTPEGKAARAAYQKPLRSYDTELDARHAAEVASAAARLPHVVIEHPSLKGKFAVVPKSEAPTQPEAPNKAAAAMQTPQTDELPPGWTVHQGEGMTEGQVQIRDEEGKARSVYRDSIEEALQEAGVGGTTATGKPTLHPQTEAQAEKPATKEQILANNAPLDHRKLGPLDLSLENRAGTTRRDLKNTPPKWSTEMKADYGYAKGIPGYDKDHLDFFVKPGTPDNYDGPVYVIDQQKENGHFDEHKTMVGWKNAHAAKQAYLAHYPKGWTGIQAMTPSTLEEVKTWGEAGGAKVGPFARRNFPERYKGPVEKGRKKEATLGGHVVGDRVSYQGKNGVVTGFAGDQFIKIKHDDGSEVNAPPAFVRDPKSAEEVAADIQRERDETARQLRIKRAWERRASAKYDFVNKFPPINPESNYAGDYDTEDTTARGLHEETTNDLHGQLATLAAIKEGIRTGTDPATGRVPKNEKTKAELKKRLQQEASQARSQLDGMFSEYEQAFGPEAARAFRKHVVATFKAPEPAERTASAAPEAKPAEAPIAKPGDMPGLYGTVDHPLTFSSGMSRRSDFGPALKANHSIGVDIGELSPKVMNEIGAGMEGSTAYLFVDSGAFGLFNAQQRALESKKLNRWTMAIDEIVKQTGIKPLDFKQIFEKYEALALAISKADQSGFANGRVFFVMPDIVGYQKESLDLLREHVEEVKLYAHGQAIFPLQRGELTLTQLYDEVGKIIGTDSYIVGIPSKAEAVPNEQLAELLKERGDRIYGIHILGAASAKAAAPRLEVIKAAGYDGPVSADANRLRALWRPAAGVPRDAALERLLAHTMAPEEAAALSSTERSERQRAIDEQLRRKAAARKVIHPDKDSLVTAIQKLGGVNERYRRDVTGDTKGSNPRLAFVGTLFTKTGRGLDELAQTLENYGYLLPADLEDTDGGIGKLTELIQAELAGKPHYSTKVDFSTLPSAQQIAEEHAADDLEPKDVTAAIDLMPEDMTPAEVLAVFDIDAALAEAGIMDEGVREDIKERAAVRADNGEDYESAAKAEIAARQDQGGAGSDREGPQAEAAAPALELTQQSEADLAQREAEAKAAADKEAAEKAKADEAARAERIKAEVKQRSQAAADTFELGQSAEQNLTGQGDIFGAPAAPKPEEPPSFTRQMKALQEVASRHGWEAYGVSGTQEIVLIRQDGENEKTKVAAFRDAQGNYAMERSHGTYAAPRGVNALAIETGSLWTWEPSHLIPWNGSRRIPSNEIFAALRAYVTDNPKAEAKPAEPEQPKTDHDHFTVERLNDASGELEPITFARGEHVRISSLNSVEEITGISHARNEFKVGDGDRWFPFGYAYKTEQPKPETKPTVPLSSAVEASNAKHGAGLTDADRIYTLAEHPAIIKRIREGDITAEELKTQANRLIASKAAVIAELNQRTVKELAPGGARAGMTKPEIVKAIYERMLGSYITADSFTWSPFTETHEAAIKRYVEKTTDEDIAKYAGERKAAREAYQKALTNPETLDEFRQFVSAKGEEALTTEQRAKFDELRADQRRDIREREKERTATVQAVGTTVGAKIIETKHTQKGHDLFVVQLEQRVDRDAYAKLNLAARKLGGYYSSFKGRGAVPGFQFKTRAEAEAFKALATEGDTQAATEAVKEHREAKLDEREKGAVNRLRTVADNLAEKSNESLNKDRTTNTARRARMASGAEENARRDLQIAETMRAIADAIESGEAKQLAGLRTKVQVEMLNRMVSGAKTEELRKQHNGVWAQMEKHQGEPPTAATVEFVEYPEYRLDRSDAYQMGHSFEKTDGLKQVGARLLKLAAEHKNEDRFPVHPQIAEDALDAVDRYNAKAGVAGQLRVSWYLGDVRERRQRLQSMGIEDTPMLRAALREFITYRAGKKEADRVKQLERDLVGSKVGIDFFPTPHEVAERMVAEADIEPGMRVLEPSAGNGNIAETVAKFGVDPDVVEISSSLRPVLEAKGFNIVGQDFMDMKVDRDTDPVPVAEVEKVRDVARGEARSMMDNAVNWMQRGNVHSALMLVERARRVTEFTDFMSASAALRDRLQDMVDRPPPYDRIVMNPPFSNSQDIEHVMHAYDLLKPDGKLVAIMGEGAFFRDDAKARKFREWLDKVGGTEERLPAGTFQDPKLLASTGANARLVVIDKGEKPMMARSPGFVSALVRKLDQSKMNAAPAEQWQRFIGSLTTQGVKPDEIEWSGVTDWLKTQTGKVRKEDVLAFVRDNGVQVDETDYSDEGIGDIDERDQLVVQLTQRGYQPEMDMDGTLAGIVRTSDNELFFTNGDRDGDGEMIWGNEQEDRQVMGEPLPPDIQRMATRLGEIAAMISGDDTNTRYGKYQLPGGKNYHELLLTLPDREQAGEAPAMLTELPEGYDPIIDSHQPEDRRWGITPPGQIHAAPWAGRHPTKEAAIAAALRKVNDERQAAWQHELFQGKAEREFRSGHFYQPNILAHVRFNERTDAEGKRVLFIEEIQSDWAQKGRREGFKTAIVPAKESEIELKRIESQPPAGQDASNYPGYWESFDKRTGNLITRHNGRMDREAVMKEAIRYSYIDAQERANKGVPAAPFVGKTEAWVALALKRMIRYAADNGFDAVAWTTGEQQADRYSLAKQVRKIEWQSKPGTTAQWVSIDTPAGLIRFEQDGGKVVKNTANAADLVGKDLEDVLGKEVAKKIFEAHRGTLEGEGLKIGGEGMKSFYDRIVPNVANDLLKKLGGGKVETVNLGEAQTPPVVPGSVYESDTRPDMTKQPGFYLTDSIREHAAQGMPLFARQTDTEAFKRWFGDSKVVDEDGKPLVVYHGTKEDFSTFRSHSQTPVYSADFKEIQKADSWDMGDDRTGAPGAYHYGALADAVQLGPEEALRIREEDARRVPPGPDTKRHIADLKRLLGKTVTMRYEQRPTNAGFYFSPDTSYSFIRDIGRVGGHVMPVYLSLKNPVYLNAAQIESAGFDFNVEKYEKQGYDGAIFAPFPDDLTKRWGGDSTQIVAFRPEQIKSATANRGTFSPSSPDILQARGTAQTSLQREYVRGAAEALVAGWKIRPAIEVLRSPEDAPAPVRAYWAAEQAGAAGDVQGFLWRDRIYLVASSLSSPDEIARVIYHEGLGHYGLRAVYGGALKPILRDLAVARAADVKAKAEAYGLDWSKQQNRDIAAEEVLVDLAETRPELGFVRRAIAAIRTALRKLGVKLELTDDELIVNYILPARRAIEGRTYNAEDGTSYTFGAEPVSARELPKKPSAVDMPIPKGLGLDAFRDFITKRRQADEAWRAQIEKAAEGEDAFAFHRPPGEQGYGERYALVTRDTYPDSPGWRLTLFEADMTPSSHEVYKTKAEAIANGMEWGDQIPVMARKRVSGDSGRQYTPEQEAYFRNVGREKTHLTVKERMAALWQDAGKKLAQGLVDSFAPIKDLDDRAYTLARLSKGSSGAFEALLKFGKLSIRDGAYDVDTSGGAIKALFTPLQGEADDFLWWVAANRASRLAQEDRENLFTPADIAAGKSLADGTTPFHYTLANGTVTTDRTLIFPDALKKFDAFNRNVMDMAEQSGLIDGEGRQYWEHEFYVPFYRVAEGDEGVRGMNIKSGLVRQEAFKALKGGTEKLNSDLLANTLQNWAHIIDAAAKNRAAARTLEAAANLGVAAPAQPGDKKTVWYKEEGEKVEYRVDDPLVLTAVSAIEYAGLRGGPMDAMSTFKRLLTVGVTASPGFKIRNFARDSIQSIALSALSYNPAKNWAEGAKALRNKQMYASMVASGGLIRFGTMLEGSEASRTRQLVKQGVKEGTILDNESKLQRLWDTVIEPVVSAYNELGNKSEEINRAALYKQLVDKGVDHATAALQARDLLDFSLQGAWTGVRFLTQVVPFMNARLQGLYKLGRSAHEDPARMAIVLGGVALASVALMLAFKDDDDWKRREEWDRDNYWWWKIGGVAYHMPKPFEVGAIGTFAERLVELFVSNEMNGARFGRRLFAVLMDNLAMNPVPQLVKPIIDLYANTDSFSGRPIEPGGMENLLPADRYNTNTTMLARGVSAAGNAVTGDHFMSPVQLDHAVRAYLGWLGTFTVQMGDQLVRPLTDQPARPAPDYAKIFSSGFASQLPEPQSRYVTDFYRQAKEIEEAYGSYRDKLRKGDTEGAKAVMEKHKPEIMRYPAVEAVRRAESQLNLQIRRIENDKTMSPTEKRERILAIQQKKDKTARLLATDRAH